MKRQLETQGCKFRKRGPRGWVCFLDSERVSSNRYLGELVWAVAQALGES